MWNVKGGRGLYRWRCLYHLLISYFFNMDLWIPRCIPLEIAHSASLLIFNSLRDWYARRFALHMHMHMHMYSSALHRYIFIQTFPPDPHKEGTPSFMSSVTSFASPEKKKGTGRSFLVHAPLLHLSFFFLLYKSFFSPIISRTTTLSLGPLRHRPLLFYCSLLFKNNRTPCISISAVQGISRKS